MRSYTCPRCPLCSTEGERRYSGLRDRLFSAPGEWNLNQCPNDACGILWLDPMPVEEDLGEAYREYFTHGFDARHNISGKRAAYLRVAYGYLGSPDAPISLKDRYLSGQFYTRFRRRSELEGLIFYLPKPAAGARLLDVGCGSGYAMALMAMLGWDVEGVEFDPDAVKTARARGLAVHQGTLAEQKFPNDTFDAVGLSHVIEHVPNPVEVMEECRRILRPGGVMVIMTPNVRSLGHKLYRSSWLALDPPRHLHIFTPSALAQTVRSAGFTNIEVTTTMRRADLIAVSSSAIRRTGRASLSGYSRARTRLARALQAIELAVLQVDDQVGEELLMRAHKHG